jgi:cellulose synthase/poly-beta-1,6-N-acetylglucosamine synthase-like glycosyltransferase
LENLLSSLKNLKYAVENYEVILIDDNSTDDSYQIAAKLVQGKSNYLLIKADTKKYPAKKGALEIGITNSKFPYILITDADCLPANNWLMGYSEMFKEGYDVIFGLAPFFQTKGTVNKISCFDNLRSNLLTFSLAKLDLPYSAAARNLGFQKPAFEEIGGFRNTLETLSGDDDLLIREAVKHQLRIGIVDFEDAQVLSNTKPTLHDYLYQKARHTQTSRHYLPVHMIILGLWHSSNILVLSSVFFLVTQPLMAIPFFIKLFFDIVIVLRFQKTFNYKFKIHQILFLQTFYEFFLVINFIFSFKKNIVWKN